MIEANGPQDPNTTPGIPSHSMVLLVDDQSMVAEALRGILDGEEDVDFHYCSRAVEAIPMAEDIKPTVILLDLVMPQVDGITLLRYLRANPDTREIPVVMLSTKEDAELKAEAFANGANDYLIKWPESVELLARIRYHSSSFIHVQERDEAFRALRRSQQQLADTNLELRRLASEAEAATKAKSSFLSSMSHDIRTPMNAILGMGELLEDTRLDAQQSEYLHVITQAGEALLALINDVLDLSKIEAGQLEMAEVPFDLRALAAGTVAILATQAQKKGVPIRLKIADEVPHQVVGDAQRLRQVLLNLLGNAVKFTRAGHVELNIHHRARENECQLSVVDTGIGIPLERLDQIFHPFVQAEADTSQRFGGTGLGLSICKRLVEAMHGRLWVESQPGQGSTFKFTARLPESREPPSLQAESLAEGGAAGPAANTGLKVLLAEDAPTNRMIVGAFLKKGGHRVETAEDGAEALEMFKSGEFDLVLMDMQMPVMDGFEATRAIREWEREQGREPTPVIALTAFAMQEDTQKCLQAGCDLHVSKPVRKEHLLKVVGCYPTRG